MRQVSVEVDTAFKVDLAADTQKELCDLAERVVEGTLAFEGKAPQQYEVSVLFTDDDFISELNKQYRSIEGPTDVLSFALNEVQEESGLTHIVGLPDILGDIVISLETANRQAQEKHEAEYHEIALLLVHGVLHLLGYDHDEPGKEAVMWERQEAVLESLGISAEQS